MIMVVVLMGLGLIVSLLLIGVVFYAIRSRSHFSQQGPALTAQTPSEILNLRYARGEITQEEYDQMRRDMGG